MFSKRELSMELSRESQAAADVVNMQKRASVAAAKATSMSDLIKNRDVINVICGEDEAELSRLRKLLKEEKQQHTTTRRAKDQLEADLTAKTNMVEAQTNTIASLQAKIMQLQKEQKQVCDSLTHPCTTLTLTYSCSLRRLWMKHYCSINLTKRSNNSVIVQI